MLQKKVLLLSNLSLFVLSFDEKLFQKEKKILLWVYARRLSDHLWFSCRRNSPVAGLN